MLRDSGLLVQGSLGFVLGGAVGYSACALKLTSEYCGIIVAILAVVAVVMVILEVVLLAPEMVNYGASIFYAFIFIGLIVGYMSHDDN